jgi:hypothetical protein
MTSSAMAVPAAETQADSAAWLTIGRFAMILAGLIFVTYPQVVLGFHSFIFRDYGLFGYPLAHYHKECFWRGEIPLWNPYNNFGLPFLAQWGTMVLYPPSLIYILLPLPWSLALFTLLHQLFGGVGMFVLARRWTGNSLAGGVAGIAFAFHGFVLNCLMWPHYSASMAWMPWVILTLMRAWKDGGRWILVAALAGGMQMLSGTPEVILFTWLLVGGLWLIESFETWGERCTAGLRLGLIVLLVTALAAAQLFPFLELLHHSERSAKFDTGQWPIPSWGWANLFVPLYRMHATGAGVYFQKEQNLTSSYYAGIAVVIAALLAVMWIRNRRVWFLFGASVIAFVFAMGSNTPLYEWMRKTFPAIGFMRYASKAVIPMAFTLPALAAAGIAAWMAVRDPAQQRRRGYWAMGCIGLTVILIAGIAAHAHWAPFGDLPSGPVLTNAGIRVVFLLASAAACWWLTRELTATRRGLLQVFVLAMFFFDLLTHAPQQNPTVDREALTVVIPWLKYMKPRPTLGESRAALSLTAQQQYVYAATPNLTETHIAHRNGLFANVNLVEGMPKADGFYALYLKEERDIHFRLFRDQDDPRPELGRFLGFSQVTAPTNVVVWHARTNYLPLVTTGQLPIFADPQTTLYALMSTNFAPENVVYLPPHASNQLHGISPGAAVIRSREIKADRVSVNVTASALSLVVIAQAHYPRWKAFVDGRPAVLLRANHAFQAVQVPAGDHQVDVVYQDRPFQIGAAISLLSLLGIIVGWPRFSRKRTNNALDQDKKPLGALLNPPLEDCLPHTIGEAQRSRSGGTSVAKGALRFVKGN